MKRYKSKFSVLRIISTVPSITELLYSLGLGDEVSGITKFCVHPREWLDSKTRIGGTKNLNLDKIKKLKPSLIIANKEENIKEQVEELAKYFEILLTDVNNFDEAIKMIEEVGTIVGKTVEARKLITSIHSRFSNLRLTSYRPAAYFIWQDPYMTVGGDTFINDMMLRAGFRNIYANRNRYPIISIEEVKNAPPEYVLLSSEPFPFTQKHADEWQQQLPCSKIILVDGEMFSWYGSRMLLAADYFKRIFA